MLPSGDEEINEGDGSYIPDELCSEICDPIELDSNQGRSALGGSLNEQVS
jgi:hypothetical protein